MTIDAVEIASSTMTDAEAELLRKNIIFFCRTPKGSLPQMREYGLDFSIIDEPFPIFQTKATVDIVTGVRKYYNINIGTIDITADEDGKVKIVIGV